MHLQELKQKSPADLLAYAEELEVENASTAEAGYDVYYFETARCQ